MKGIGGIGGIRGIRGILRVGVKKGSEGFVLREVLGREDRRYSICSI